MPGTTLSPTLEPLEQWPRALWPLHDPPPHMHTPDNRVRSRIVVLHLDRLRPTSLFNVADLLRNSFGVPGRSERNMESGTHLPRGGFRRLRV